MYQNYLLRGRLDVYIMLEVLVKLCIPVLSIMLNENKIEWRLQDSPEGLAWECAFQIPCFS